MPGVGGKWRKIWCKLIVFSRDNSSRKSEISNLHETLEGIIQHQEIKQTLIKYVQMMMRLQRMESVNWKKLMTNFVKRKLIWNVLNYLLKHQFQGKCQAPHQDLHRAPHQRVGLKKLRAHRRPGTWREINMFFQILIYTWLIRCGCSGPPDQSVYKMWKTGGMFDTASNGMGWKGANWPPK